MPKNKGSSYRRRSFPLGELLPKLAPHEEEDQQTELENMAAADAQTGQFLVGGVLLSATQCEDITSIRLSAAVDRLSDEEIPEHVAGEIFGLVVHRTEWAYRIGLAVGFRLALAVPAKGGAE